MAVCNDVFAEPMLDEDEYLDKYLKQLRSLNEEGLLPDLKKEMVYKVYSIQGSDWGAHKSIVLTTNDKNFVTVELGFIKIDGKKRIYPVTRSLKPASKANLTFHGEIKTTGGKLISKAVATMKKFGSYFKFCNNCQDYCNLYLESIGLGKEKKLTDGDKAILVTIAGAVLLLILAVFARR